MRKNSYFNFIILILIIILGVFCYKIFGLLSEQAKSNRDFGVTNSEERLLELVPLYKMEEEATIKFFKQYQVIRQLYENISTNNISIDEFNKGINSMSEMVSANYNYYEDFRLNFRYQVKREVLNGSEYNQLYFLSFEIRNALLSYVEEITNNQLISKQGIKDAYSYQITNRFEKHLIQLVDLLQIPEEEINLYELKNVSVEEGQKRLSNSKLEQLRYDLTEVIGNSSFKLLPKINNEEQLFILLYLEAAYEDEEKLLNKSEQLFSSLFINNNIDQVVLFWGGQTTKTRLMIGIDKESFQSYLDSNYKVSFLPRTSFLYKYESS